MLPRIIPNLRLNETNEFQDDLAQPILIGKHKGDKQNSLSHLKTGFGIMQNPLFKFKFANANLALICIKFIILILTKIDYIGSDSLIFALEVVV